MRFEGRVDRYGKSWIAEAPAFEVEARGRTKREALARAADWIEFHAHARGFEVTIHATDDGRFEIEANRPGFLLAVMLQRQRDHRDLSLADVARRLGQRSRNAYARYEQARASPTLEQLDRLLAAVAPDRSWCCGWSKIPSCPTP